LCEVFQCADHYNIEQDEVIIVIYVAKLFHIIIVEALCLFYHIYHEVEVMA
jgi:hypothetical protein